jgi:hypothetical protein
MTTANVADSEGNIDAIEFIAASSISTTYSSLNTGMVLGSPTWVEFDLKQGSASPLATITMAWQLDVGGIDWQRILTPPAAWQRYRFLFLPRRNSASLILKLIVPGAGRVQVGRARIYQAREPLPYSLHTYGGLAPGSPALAVQSAAFIYMVSGVPNNANGNNGDFCFRYDTPGTVNQRLYVKSVGAWVGIL